MFLLFVIFIQSNEVKGSYHMELEGFKRTIKKLNDSGLVVGKLVTDRHRQLAKYVREKTDISHMFDVWHIAKGMLEKFIDWNRQSSWGNPMPRKPIMLLYFGKFETKKGRFWKTYAIHPGT